MTSSTFYPYLRTPLPWTFTLAVFQPCILFLYIGVYVFMAATMVVLPAVKLAVLIATRLNEAARDLSAYVFCRISRNVLFDQRRLCCLGCKANYMILAWVINRLRGGAALLENAIALAESSKANCRVCVCAFVHSGSSAECDNILSNLKPQDSYSDIDSKQQLNSSAGNDLCSYLKGGYGTDSDTDKNSQTDSGSDSRTYVEVSSNLFSTLSVKVSYKTGDIIDSSSYDRDNSGFSRNVNAGSGIAVMGGYSNVYASGNGNGVCLKSAFRPYDPTEADFVMTAPLPPFTCYALPQVAKSSVVVATTEVFDPTQDLPSAYLDHWGWKTMLRWMEKIVRGLNERRLRHGRLYEEINQADTTWAHSTLKMAFDSSLVELESHLNTFDYAWSPEENRPKSRVFKPWDPSSH